MEQMTTSITSTLKNEFCEGLKVISFLLQYPEKRWLQVQELIDEAEELTNESVKNQILKFLTIIGDKTFDELQQHYVNTFDFYEACSLHLSFLKMGEKRERGTVLIELKSLYSQYGFQLTDEELSDYLPVVLEFASVAPFHIATNFLNSFKETIDKLYAELNKLNSPYAILLETCIKLIDEMNLIKEC